MKGAWKYGSAPHTMLLACEILEDRQRPAMAEDLDGAASNVIELIAAAREVIVCDCSCAVCTRLCEAIAHCEGYP